MSQTILTSAPAGAVEYTWPLTVTEATGKDISGDTVLVSLGTYAEPGTWAAPDVITRPTPSSVVVQKLIDNTVTPGIHWLWIVISDSPERVPRRGDRVTVV